MGAVDARIAEMSQRLDRIERTIDRIEQVAIDQWLHAAQESGRAAIEMVGYGWVEMAGSQARAAAHFARVAIKLEQGDKVK